MTNQGKRKYTVSLDELLNTHYKVHTIWAGHSHATTSRRKKHYDISIDRITSVKTLRQISYSYNIVSSLVAVILYCHRFVGTSSFLATFSRKYYENCPNFLRSRLRRDRKSTAYVLICELMMRKHWRARMIDTMASFELLTMLPLWRSCVFVSWYLSKALELAHSALIAIFCKVLYAFFR